ncbi:MAG: 50S ribosomal protein L24 [Candidatus Taylorbacteria bacterium RIFCSPHIGHO2_02_49_25]|uniref:Large ribosomal subunit protein uL24 n=1 Tax=Candidatus Taylorbacteria bacterium RIFCSPHIGHO2_02_49_25 TaxID=1802305 RepID=A0A1G2ME22_9BACT|nr:MAG: 50S ribosomal protein L24 [Parcubacteria group bacterium GW2011_GWF2_50_9]OHA21429.1 MAG: 50S ribosomal protein L24 [Candidatus Taylorbacteria bacterium RIFCSPHIGHO2_02_49_25]OHA21595.1 MAG: 50S ribosomal protein L24 [Candidatus Taylorbacteria bacterium RIFCSPHIGHO2_01_FULL_49_60]OHA36802.1 MAG: 50S ribosomal protein L24 [Candidatus Taylorbacteria bacterium RIFCSPLOWO2_01_FULL_50_130]OHA36912.1 MAG: 50S ribosomal protein L24 [Candidatus Taylorbacteria bacterium RIFCSPLOWO2_02_50_13]OHA
MIKKGDNVIVISGKEKGKKGAVARVLRSRQAVIIEGLNLSKRHQKPRKAGQKGQVVEKAMPIHISNVALVEGGKAVRSGKKLVGERWVRVSRKTGKEI